MNVWLVPVAFVAFCGVIVIRASTYCFVAGPEPPGPAVIAAVAGSVSRVTVTALNKPVIENVVVAFAVTRPAEADVNVAEKCPAASVVPLNGPAGLGAAPFDGVRVIVTGASADRSEAGHAVAALRRGQTVVLLRRSP